MRLISDLLSHRWRDVLKDGKLLWYNFYWSIFFYFRAYLGAILMTFIAKNFYKYKQNHDKREKEREKTDEIPPICLSQRLICLSKIRGEGKVYSFHD